MGMGRSALSFGGTGDAAIALHAHRLPRTNSKTYAR